MKRIANVDTTTTYIAVSADGSLGTKYMNRDGDMGYSHICLSPADATTALNCVESGYWGDISSGVVIGYKARSSFDTFYIDRVIEVSKVIEDPIEYRVVRNDAAELMFMVCVDRQTGETKFVGDMFLADPFVDNFSEGRIYYFNDLVEPDRAIQRNFVGNAARDFVDMFHMKYSIDIVWAKVKE